MASSMAWPSAALSWGQGTAISTPVLRPSPRALSAEDGNIVSGTPCTSQVLKEKDREGWARGSQDQDLLQLPTNSHLPISFESVYTVKGEKAFLTLLFKVIPLLKAQKLF